MSREPIFEELADHLSRLMHHRRYHDHQDTATATTVMRAITATEAPVSFADIENEIHKLADHAKQIEHEILPAAAKGVKELESLAGNPVVLSLLSAIHVPTEALTMAVKVIDGLEELYKPDTAVSAPSEPVVPAEPVVAPAEPVAAPAVG